VAAGVLVAAVLPRLEVRAGNGEIAVRWGKPTGVTTQLQNGIGGGMGSLVSSHAERLTELEARVRAAEERTKQVEELAAAHRELKDLLLVVAADVSKLDDSQKAAADRHRTLASWVSTRLRDVDGSLADVRKDQTAMYTLVTDCRK
jgi:hypothetical protein